MTMKKHIVALILLALIGYYPVTAYTEEPLITTVYVGDVVPYTGSLLNDTAIAEILAQDETNQVACDLRVEHEVSINQAFCDLQESNHGIAMEASERRFQLMLDLKNEEINTLTTLLIESEEPADYSEWWLIGGVVLGTALTSVVVFIVSD